MSIFGTLFERGLDPGKRSQLGAHYTDPVTIMRIVEPVLKRQLLQVWEQLTPVLQALLAKSTKKSDKNYKLGQRQLSCFWPENAHGHRAPKPLHFRENLQQIKAA